MMLGDGSLGLKSSGTLMRLIETQAAGSLLLSWPQNCDITGDFAALSWLRLNNLILQTSNTVFTLGGSLQLFILKCNCCLSSTKFTATGDYQCQLLITFLNISVLPYLQDLT